MMTHSDSLAMAPDLATDLHKVGAMDKDPHLHGCNRLCLQVMA
jgi:hypothetical protein